MSKSNEGIYFLGKQSVCVWVWVLSCVPYLPACRSHPLKHPHPLKNWLNYPRSDAPMREAAK